jgi:multidrug efflux pump subunit AcrA (membrane-fusion protein)
MVAERSASGQYTARRAMVETGQSYLGKIEIVKGLQKGQHIITEGNEGLGDGQAIEVLENSQQ